GRRACRSDRPLRTRAGGLGAHRGRRQRGARQARPPDHRRAPPRHRVSPELPRPLLLRAVGLGHREAPRREGHPHGSGDRRAGRGDPPPLGRRL
ncbi:MAG: Nitrile hydratase beta subunit, partial [uncultured Rubrobacteraceae bacterium]